MMKQQLNRALVAILTTLAESEGAPSGFLFVALQTRDAELYTHAAYMQILGIMVRAELVTDEHDYIKLTDKGGKLAADIEADLAAQRAAAQ